MRALKIRSIELDTELAKAENRETTGGAIIFPVESGYASFPVSHAYLRKHKPKIGGYYVVYEDGYESYSPAKAFEGGYQEKGSEEKTIIPW